MLRTVQATRYVTPLREGGSLPGLVEADDDGLYVLKFRGAGQGPLALVAEVLAGEIGRRLGLPVPEIVLLELDPALGAAEPDPDVRELIDRSGGTNLGMDFLPGSLGFRPGVGPAPDSAFAAAVVWFDALVTNPDRTMRNPNILVWHGRQWLIDHGAALYIHHTWRDVDRHAHQAFERSCDHILLHDADSIADADERLAPELTPEVLQSIVDLVPEAWLGDDALSRRTIRTPGEQRRAYVEYLTARLESPRTFAEEAEHARMAAQATSSAGVRRG